MASEPLIYITYHTCSKYKARVREKRKLQKTVKNLVGTLIHFQLED